MVARSRIGRGKTRAERQRLQAEEYYYDGSKTADRYRRLGKNLAVKSRLQCGRISSGASL